MEIYRSNASAPVESIQANGAKRKKKTALLVIDPQVDFHPGGSLAVANANNDAKRIAALLNTHGNDIDGIFVTLDTHQQLHVAHGMFWKDAHGQSPPPFTLISAADVESGKWLPALPQFRQWGLHYTKQLEANGRFTLCIWPEHCLVGSAGHAVQPDIFGAINAWERTRVNAARYFVKGNNSLTEHYSAIKADVVVEDDPSTGVNTVLVNALKGFDRVIICGQALSHCVNFTTRDLADLWDQTSLSQLVVLTDASSPVTGFEGAGESFLSDMAKKGLSLATCAEIVL